MTRKMDAGLPAADPRIVEGFGRETVDSIKLPLGPVCSDLEGTEVEVRIEDGAMVVASLHPSGDPLFKAMPNACIEERVRMALTRFAKSTAADPATDALGGAVHAEGCILYPPHMDDMPRPVERRTGAMIGEGNLAALGVAVVLGTLLLVATGMVHPLVLMLVPGVGIGAWALFQARGRETASVTSLPGYEQHLRRGRAQAISISRAASRARGLST